MNGLNAGTLELLLRGIPEAFLMVLAIHAFSKEPIRWKRYILSSVSLLICAYIINMLPINYGVRTMLNLTILIILSININKIEVLRAVKSSLFIVIAQYIFEGVNLILIQFVFKADINKILENKISRIIYGVPSIIMLAIVVVVYYILVVKKSIVKRE
ncbi:MAG: hypothetical protein RSB70_00045 [Clostridium sp.]